MTVLLVIAGAAIGAPLRYLTDLLLRERLGPAFPWGTFIVNILGSALLGFLVALPADPALAAAAGTGLCGALTTYSTFGHDIWSLTSGSRRRALLYTTVTLAAGLAAAWLGMFLAELL